MRTVIFRLMRVLLMPWAIIVTLVVITLIGALGAVLARLVARLW